ncbi:hypothetical protein [Kingella sp. (in: b-proteobacteria)]|uniref:hypothetical protein n=1 Tax=Kingella sp. (in: b-proteobacteria) TaxID=2020713 RepID=UPI0026DBF179|nr:hypothetical protein [Kingella sp. (in: b-proteobacteria)]
MTAFLVFQAAVRSFAKASSVCLINHLATSRRRSICRRAFAKMAKTIRQPETEFSEAKTTVASTSVGQQVPDLRAAP